MRFTGILAIVTDIEGTTSSLSFVHDVLFPYARAHLPSYVRAHADELGPLIAEIAKESGHKTLSPEESIQILLKWMDEDRKITPLKTLQGMVWAKGYAQGDFKGHVFSDVPAKLRNWAEAGIRLYIYSSGSIAAQKQIFGFSEAGDLTPYFSGYFDTTIGGKKDSDSYVKIARAADVPNNQILFLSDHPDELRAAQDAGYCILGLKRPGNNLDLGAHPYVRSFDEITLEQEHDSAA